MKVLVTGRAGEGGGKRGGIERLQPWHAMACFISSPSNPNPSYEVVPALGKVRTPSKALLPLQGGSSASLPLDVQIQK